MRKSFVSEKTVILAEVLPASFPKHIAMLDILHKNNIIITESFIVD